MKNGFEKKNDINIMKNISCAIEHFLRFLRDFLRERERNNENELNRASVVVTNVFELTFSRCLREGGGREKGKRRKPKPKHTRKKEENNGSHFINHFLNLIRNVCFRANMRKLQCVHVFP
jgi:hypothetical protein